MDGREEREAGVGMWPPHQDGGRGDGTGQAGKELVMDGRKGKGTRQAGDPREAQGAVVPRMETQTEELRGGHHRGRDAAQEGTGGRWAGGPGVGVLIVLRGAEQGPQQGEERQHWDWRPLARALHWGAEEPGAQAEAELKTQRQGDLGTET